jgi:hypothetical protein
MTRYAISLPPFQCCADTSRSSALPILEFKPNQLKARLSRKRNFKSTLNSRPQECSFGRFNKQQLEVKQWQFFHAAVKTELTHSFTAAQAYGKAIGYANYRNDILDWQSFNLRLTERDKRDLEDFANAETAGRFGEAVAYLTMISMGYVYWDRLEVLLKRILRQKNVQHDDALKLIYKITRRKLSGKQSDFVFEKQNQETSLMESKGSFVSRTRNKPTLKRDLQYALSQLARWATGITPTPQKSFAIGTYFRDVDDPADPSLIAVVDPPGEPDEKVPPIEVPDDAIRRGNYGAWLIGMGFEQAGNALRLESVSDAKDQRQREVQLPVISVNGTSFAIKVETLVVDSVLTSRITNGPAGPESFPFANLLGPYWEVSYYDIYRALEELRYFPHGLRGFATRLKDSGFSDCGVTGIELNTLRLIETALAAPESTALLRHESLQQFSALSVENSNSEQGFAGSILPDGTMLGEIGLDLLATAELETFKL